MSRIHRYVPALALAGLVALAAPACAAQTYGYPRGGGGYGREAERRAYDRGYREGLDEGRDDARHNRRYSLESHDEYRDADDGYRRSDGDRDFYRRSYRTGFQAGYNEAYNRNGRSGEGTYPGYPNSSYPSYPPSASPRGYGTIARDNGYREGVDAGRRDARDRERYDPIRAMKRYYRDDSGYDNRYGSRDDYKRDYAAAFEQGYRQGYGRR